MSPKAGIKCFAGNNKLNDALLHAARSYDTTIEKVTELTAKEWLWTGESVYCNCSHHVQQHFTIGDENSHEITIHCHGSEERCNCEDFRTCSIRLSHSNCYKMVTEGLIDDFEALKLPNSNNEVKKPIMEAQDLYKDVDPIEQTALDGRKVKAYHADYLKFLTRIGFKIAPTFADGRGFNTKDLFTEEEYSKFPECENKPIRLIYRNPDIWTNERSEQEAWRFEGIRYVTGQDVCARQ